MLERRSMHFPTLLRVDCASTRYRIASSRFASYTSTQYYIRLDWAVPYSIDQSANDLVADLEPGSCSTDDCANCGLCNRSNHPLPNAYSLAPVIPLYLFTPFKPFSFRPHSIQRTTRRRPIGPEPKHTTCLSSGRPPRDGTGNTHSPRILTSTMHHAK